MLTQGLDSQRLSSLSQFPLTGNSKSKPKHSSQFHQSTLNAQIYSESYKAESISFEFKSKDGDSVSLSIESVEFQKKLLQAGAQGDKESMKDLVSYIREQLKDTIRSIVPGYDQPDFVKINDSKKVPEVLQIPEYWNAENTSQRIVDFSLSFFEGSGLEDEEYLEKIKDAISEGFKQAKEILGELSDEITELTENTYNLVMKKLDAWIFDRENLNNQDIQSTV